MGGLVASCSWKEELLVVRVFKKTFCGDREILPRWGQKQSQVSNWDLERGEHSLNTDQAESHRDDDPKKSQGGEEHSHLINFCESLQVSVGIEVGQGNDGVCESRSSSASSVAQRHGDPCHSHLGTDVLISLRCQPSIVSAIEYVKC